MSIKLVLPVIIFHLIYLDVTMHLKQHQHQHPSSSSMDSSMPPETAAALLPSQPPKESFIQGNKVSQTQSRRIVTSMSSAPPIRRSTEAGIEELSIYKTYLKQTMCWYLC